MEEGRKNRMRDSWEWLAFAASLPSRPVNFSIAAGGESIFGGRCIFNGFAYVNAAGAGESIEFHDGQDATGPLLATLFASSGGRGVVPIPPPGILCDIGVFLTGPTGLVTGSAFIIPLDQYAFTPPGH